MPPRALLARWLLAVCLVLTSTAAAQVSKLGTTTTNQVFQTTSSASGSVVNAYLCVQTPNPITGDCGLTGLTVDNTASAAAGGVLRVRASLAAITVVPQLVPPIPSGTTTWGVVSSAQADLFDEITFAGTLPAYIRFNYAIDGIDAATSVNGLTNLAPSIRLFLAAMQAATPTLPPNGAQMFLHRTSGTASRADTIATFGHQDYAVTGNDPMYFYISLLAAANIGRGLGTAMTGNATADWSNTTRWGIQAFDANGNDITDDAAMTFGLGVAYPTTVSPEPASAILVGTGLLLLMTTRRARRRSATTVSSV